MTNYCAGFLFSGDSKFVVLIKKTRPKWQAGLWNGVGGHLGAGETPVRAMVREFSEETGISTVESTWKHFCTLTDNNHFAVYFFSGKSTQYNLDVLEQKTDEEVRWWPVEHATSQIPAIPNIAWLLPMAFSLDKGEKATLFEVTER